MSKIVTAADACKIGREAIEAGIEQQFRNIMDLIADRARYENSIEYTDRCMNSYVHEDSTVEFLQSHPEQVDRLINMGFQVEQEIDDQVPKSYESTIYKVVPHFFFWKKSVYETKTIELMLTIRKFTITWECEECDDERDEATV